MREAQLLLLQLLPNLESSFKTIAQVLTKEALLSIEGASYKIITLFLIKECKEYHLLLLIRRESSCQVTVLVH